MKTFKGYILNEASTSKATMGENAIVYNYNKHVKNMSHEDALSTGGMNQKDFDKANKFGLIESQKVTAEALPKGWGGMMMTTKGGKNHYPGASDKTPKTDIMDVGRKELISLKMAGDKGSGAQLISSKSAEAAGCVDAGVKHWGALNDLSTLPEFKNAMHILQVEMKESIMSDSIIRAGEAKADVGQWYMNSSGRFKALTSNAALKNKKYSKKQIEDHMKAELKRFKVIDQTANFEKKFLPEIPQGNGGESNRWVGELIQPSYATIQNKILPAYVENETGLSTDNLDQPISPNSKIKWTKYNKGADEQRIKAEVKQIVLTSMKTVAWKQELENFFQTNQGVRKWIVYEAASGLTKFTGKSYGNPGTERVANRMMVFKEGGGLKTWYNSIEAFAADHTNLLGKLDISFKSSGTDKYIKLGIPVNESIEMPFNKTLDECVDAEWSTLNEDIEQIYSEYLTEGFWRDMGKKLKGATSVVLDIAAKVKDKIWQAMKAFYNRVILRFVDKLASWASQGMGTFLRMSGLQIQAAMVMATPAW
jgi:hypothetical protein